MTRTGQYCCVIAALVLCLALVVFSIGGVSTASRADARTGDEARPPARLEALEATVETLLPAARQYALTGGAAERRRFERLLSRLDEAGAAVDGGGLAPAESERRQLLEAARHMLPRIRAVGREILALPDVGANGTAQTKLGALIRLGDKTLAALAQLSATPAPSESPRSTLSPQAAASVVPEGVAVLLITIVCAVGMALASATRRLRAGGAAMSRATALR
jgi:hypothetical protein